MVDSRNARKAYNFYKQFVLDYSVNKSVVYKQYGFATIQVNFRDWEVFAAILLNDRAKVGKKGADLMRHEVKSAIFGNSFEYQYHKRTGLEKLAEDRAIDHVFIARSSDYLEIEVWLVTPDRFADIFGRWLPELRQNYELNARQRFRRSIPYDRVSEEGTCILRIEGSHLVEIEGES